MNRRSEVIITVVGTTGTATTREQIVGLIDGIYLDYDAAAPSTADLTVVEANMPYPQTILTKLNTNTDQWFYPRKALTNGADGSALSQYDFYDVNDFIKFTIAQATDGEVFRGVVLWDDMK